MPPPTILVTFVRTEGARDRIYVARADGTESSWVFPTYGDAPPHDLVHLIVEAELGLEHGLWGRVAGGADLGAIAAVADRTSGGIAEKYAALGDLRDVLVSEAAAAAVSMAQAMEPAARRAALDETAARFGADIPAHLDGAALERARARLDEIAARWRALGAKGALAFTWPGAALVDAGGAGSAAGSPTRGASGTSPARRRPPRSRR